MYLTSLTGLGLTLIVQPVYIVPACYTNATVAFLALLIHNPAML